MFVPRIRMQKIDARSFSLDKQRFAVGFKLVHLNRWRQPTRPSSVQILCCAPPVGPIGWPYRIQMACNPSIVAASGLGTYSWRLTRLHLIVEMSRRAILALVEPRATSKEVRVRSSLGKYSRSICRLGLARLTDSCLAGDSNRQPNPDIPLVSRRDCRPAPAARCHRVATGVLAGSLS
jgi:hypothetical protein